MKLLNGELLTCEMYGTSVTITNYNDDFLLLRADDIAKTGKIGKAIFEQQFDFTREVIVTEIEICLKLNDKFDISKLGVLNELKEEQYKEARIYKVPIYFDDHEDWKEIISFSGFQKEVFIAKLTAIDFSIAMFAFLPGFIYMNGLPKSLQIPRKKVPAKYIKANSIAIGGKYLGLYSLDSPGGWHVIGQTPIPILQIPQIPPVAINLDDTVRLYEIDKAEYERLLLENLTIQDYNA